MHLEFNAQSADPFALRKKRNDTDVFASPGLASDGFNSWWQKTAAQNMAMVSEASDLMRAHRLVSAARQPRARQAH
jgi:hypothetical protein